MCNESAVRTQTVANKNSIGTQKNTMGATLRRRDINNYTKNVLFFWRPHGVLDNLATLWKRGVIWQGLTDT